MSALPAKALAKRAPAVLPQGSELLRKEDVARMLGVSPRTIERYLARRKFRAVRLSSRAVRFRLCDVQRWVAQMAGEPVGVW